MKKAPITPWDRFLVLGVILVFGSILGINVLQRQLPRNAQENQDPQREYQVQAPMHLYVVNFMTGDSSKHDVDCEDRILEVSGALGTSLIEISHGQARMVDSPCRDKICVDVFGWLDRVGSISVCLPNQIMLELREPE